MRITGGEFGGRNLKVPKSDAIRPTQDRVREALFSMIQFELPGADFLDLFAGSGSVGIEALSRGAKSATFVESSRRHMPVLQENLRLVSAQPLNVSTSQRLNHPFRRLPLDRLLFGAGVFDRLCGPSLRARGGAGLRRRPRDAGGEGRGATRRTLHRRDDFRPEGGGDAGLGAGPGPDVREDAPLPLAAERQSRVDIPKRFLKRRLR